MSQEEKFWQAHSQWLEPPDDDESEGWFATEEDEDFLEDDDDFCPVCANYKESFSEFCEFCKSEEEE